MHQEIETHIRQAMKLRLWGEITIRFKNGVPLLVSTTAQYQIQKNNCLKSRNNHCEHPNEKDDYDDGGIKDLLSLRD
jgi:hypothetical protein